MGAGAEYTDLVWHGGDPLPTPEELAPWVLHYKQDTVWEGIQARRDSRQKTGGTPVGPHWFHSDDTSRIQQLALVMMGANMPSGIMWKTMGGEFVQMTPTLAGQIFQSCAAQDMGTFAIAEHHKATMLTLPDPSQYDYSTGWPKIFGE